MVVCNALEKYGPKNSDYATSRKNLLINAKKFYDGREMIINAFKNKTSPHSTEHFFQDEDKDEDEDEDEFDTPRGKLKTS